MNAPARVAIVAPGPSRHSYVELAIDKMGRQTMWDEVWGVNDAGQVLNVDRIFHMDDIAVYEIIQRHINPDLPGMYTWLRDFNGPIYTSTSMKDVLLASTNGCEETAEKLRALWPLYEPYPNLVSYPLKEVIESVRPSHLNTTVAYAVAYAIYIGVEELALFGCDFTYSSYLKAEAGRGCVEGLLGVARERGIKIFIPSTSTLMDANRKSRWYGYDIWDMDVTVGGDGVTITKTPRAIPTGEEAVRMVAFDG